MRCAGCADAVERGAATASIASAVKRALASMAREVISPRIT
jgi:hypothetical protein